MSRTGRLVKLMRATATRLPSQRKLGTVNSRKPTCPLQTATGNLERVRKVKTRHQRLFSRVTAVREELQRFLEDDDDMVKMCLTRKRELEQAANQSGAGGEHCTCCALL